MKIAKRIVSNTKAISTDAVKIEAADESTIIIDNEYISDLQSSCEKELHADTITWETSDDTISMTLTYGDNIIDFEIPKEDLVGDVVKDTAYIMDSVRDTVVETVK